MVDKIYEVPCIRDKVEKINSSDTRDASKAAILEVSVPGSKSITNRALLLAALASGKSSLKGVLFSDDSRHFLSCIQDLGLDITIDEPAREVTIKGNGCEFPNKAASINVGSAGTAARFLAAAIGASTSDVYMDASDQMKKRPMEPLLSALTELGAKITYPSDGVEGHFPFQLTGNGFCKSEIEINIDKSSQFLSALLIAAVSSKEDFVIHVKGSHGMAYIEMTCKMMEQFGVNARRDKADFIIPAGQSYKALCYDIEPDASAAAYFYGMCPLIKVPVRVKGMHFESLQGDVEFVRLLEKMGCEAVDEAAGIVLYPPKDGHFKGVTVDMSAFSDQAITLAAIAPFAEGPTTITGIGHIRLQESDRLSGIAKELSKLGIKVEEGADCITIYPGEMHGAEIETYEDHRMAMGFSLVGLLTEGVKILNPGCCAKTFENYFEVLDSVIASVENL